MPGERSEKLDACNSTPTAVSSGASYTCPDGGPGYRREAYGGGLYLGLVPQDGRGVELLLQRTGYRKSGKNRMHLDLRTAI